jgi:hypothetical protein
MAVENFRLSLTVQKLCDFFDLHAKCSQKILGRDCPLEKFLFDETSKGTSLGQSAPIEARTINIG